MATVYLARDTMLDRPVVLKVLAEHLAHDASFRDRFQREARLAAKLVHPNIVQIYDVGEDERVFLIPRHDGEYGRVGVIAEVVEHGADGLAAGGYRAQLTVNDPMPLSHPPTCFEGDPDVLALPPDDLLGHVR